MDQETTTIKRTFMQGLLTPQTMIYILGGMIALVVFWTRTQESWAKVKELENTVRAMQEAKADQSDIKAIEDRVSRQYETSNKISERVNALEKQQEYQRGISDGKKQNQ
jgi:Flp pilus assembly protein TadB